MASVTPSPPAWLVEAIDQSTPVQPYLIAVTVLSIVLISAVVGVSGTKNTIPLANPPAWSQLRFQKQLGFLREGMDIINSSRRQYFGKPFRILNELGESIVLPPDFAHSIRNDSSLNFRKAVNKDFHGHLPGFSPFGIVDDQSQVLQRLARKQLTKYLNTVTEPLSSEATFATGLIFGNSTEWREIPLKESILQLVARLSSRVFLGEGICRNEDWLKITQQYTVTSFKAATKLNNYPRIIRRLVNLVDGDCKRLRGALVRARDIIGPVIEKRRELKEEARSSGLPVPSFNDAIEWAECESNGHDIDAVVLQLALSFVAIHTTTDLLAQTLLFLANDPEIIEPLRQEMVEVLQLEGWKKTALYKMKLLDSAIKETQRMKPTGMLAMRRLAVEDVTLPDGTRIRKGDRTVVDGYNMINPELHSEPGKFDVYRFRRMREEPGNEHKAQLVATSAEQLTFGHGQYACPGRFFAANEIKIALCHLLLKYDWKLAPGSTTQPIVTGSTMSINPGARVLFRRRKEEINLESLEVDHEAAERNEQP